MERETCNDDVSSRLFYLAFKVEAMWYALSTQICPVTAQTQIPWSCVKSILIQTPELQTQSSCSPLYLCSFFLPKMAFNSSGCLSTSFFHKVHTVCCPLKIHSARNSLHSSLRISLYYLIQHETIIFF